MASLRQHPKSPFWSACFTLPDGRRTTRSTGTSDKRQALRVAQQYEDASREASSGRFIESRARKTIADIYALANPEKLTSSTAGDYFDAWLKRKTVEASEKSNLKYASIVKQFREYLGAKVHQDIATIVASDIAGFRDALSGRVSVSTVNTALKVVRIVFGQALKDGFCDTNEAARVSMLKRRANDFERRPFSLEELKRILEVSSPEWKGMIMFGLYSGQRLGDLARLTWQNLDLHRAELQFVTQKTGRRQKIPIAAPLMKFIEGMTAGDEPSAPLFPKLHAIVDQSGMTGHLSNQFYGILVAANLAPKRTHKTGHKGRGSKRVQNSLSFHCLRHTATTFLKAGGASNAIAQEIIGHSSESISKQYTHLSTENLRDAVDSIPDITK